MLSLNLDDIRFLMDDYFDPVFKTKMLQGRCPVCKREPVEIVLKQCFLSDKNDVMVNGWCRSCKFERRVQFAISLDESCRERADYLREMRAV